MKVINEWCTKLYVIVGVSHFKAEIHSDQWELNEEIDGS